MRTAKTRTEQEKRWKKIPQEQQSCRGPLSVCCKTWQCAAANFSAVASHSLTYAEICAAHAHAHDCKTNEHNAAQNVSFLVSWIIKQEACSTPTLHTHTHTHRQTHTQTHKHTRFANKQTSSTTPGPNVRFLVSWTVKQDRACATPRGAVLRGQACSSDLGLQRKKDGAALWRDRPQITTTSSEYLPSLVVNPRAGSVCTMRRIRVNHTHTHTHTHTMETAKTRTHAQTQKQEVEGIRALSEPGAGRRRYTRVGCTDEVRTDACARAHTHTHTARERERERERESERERERERARSADTFTNAELVELPGTEKKLCIVSSLHTNSITWYCAVASAKSLSSSHVTAAAVTSAPLQRDHV